MNEENTVVLTEDEVAAHNARVDNLNSLLIATQNKLISHLERQIQDLERQLQDK